MEYLYLYFDIFFISLGFTVFSYYVLKRFYLFVTKNDKYKDIYDYHEKHKKMVIVGVVLVIIGVLLSLLK